MTTPAVPMVTLMTSMVCARSAPPRSSAFQLACMNAADSTSTMEKGVSKAGSIWCRSVRTSAGATDDPALSLERRLQAIELRHQRIADRGAFRHRRVDSGIEAADLGLQGHR